MLKHFSLKFTSFLILSDLLIFTLSWALGFWLRLALPYGKPFTGSYNPPVLYVAMPVIFLTTFVLRNVYSPRNAYRVFHEILSLVSASLIAFALLAGILYLTFREVSRIQAIYVLLLVLLFLFIHRLGLRAYFRIAGGRKLDALRVCIIGEGELAKTAYAVIQENRWAGFYIVGYVALAQGEESASLDLAPRLGVLQDLDSIISTNKINEVVIASESLSEEDLQRLVRSLFVHPVNVRVVLNVSDLAYLRPEIEMLGELPVLTLREPVLSPFDRITKRIFDIVFSSVALLLSLPLFVIIAILIKVTSKGSVFFTQERLGEKRRLFRMIKFRTMRADADKGWEEVSKYDENGKIVHKQREDPRVTSIGRILRRTSLDELPQLINVLKGEMSIVGPRPEMPRLLPFYETWQHKRFEVPQGMTGWWQVIRGDDSLMYQHTEDDLYYIRNYSLFFDIQILAKTLGTVISGRGAF